MIALAQAWRDRGGVVTIACCECPEKLQIRLKKENIKYCQLSAGNPGDREDQIQTVALAVELKCTWVVLDGYRFNCDFHRRLREQGLKVMAVDDYGQNDCWEVDAILNQNVSATDMDYTSLVDDCRIMLGTSFALLRKEFIAVRPRMCRQVASTPKILVTLGGGDPDNATAKIVSLLNKIEQSELEIRVLVGALNPHVKELTRLVAESWHKIEILQNVTDMPSMYKWADGVISAAGSTCLEWLYFSLPAAVVVIAENQKAIADHLASREIATNLGWHSQVEEVDTASELRDWMDSVKNNGPKTQRLVDGLGARRVAAQMDNGIWVRPACAADMETYLKWVNDPDVRCESVQQSVVTPGEHASWFERRLEDSRTQMFVACNQAALIGQVRLEENTGGQWEVDFSVDAGHRGKGLGFEILRLAFGHMKTHADPTIVARVKKGNLASQRCFQKLGFDLTNGTTSDLLEFCHRCYPIT
jgi:UDP-2,4-diacetamido-2,4,6-trideoxy-beta-L-altropyranose hydrolase